MNVLNFIQGYGVTLFMLAFVVINYFFTEDLRKKSKKRNNFWVITFAILVCIVGLINFYWPSEGERINLLLPYIATITAMCYWFKSPERFPIIFLPLVVVSSIILADVHYGLQLGNEDTVIVSFFALVIDLMIHGARHIAFNSEQ